VPGQPRRYVQDRIRERAADVAELLRGDSFVYICGLKGMESRRARSLHERAAAGMDWPALHAALCERRALPRRDVLSRPDSPGACRGARRAS
jgi:benzoyl-CoA 2,3-dioxygenase component A